MSRSDLLLRHLYISLLKKLSMLNNAIFPVKFSDRASRRTSQSAMSAIEPLEQRVLLSAATEIDIDFTLSTDTNVSLVVQDQNGATVRELLRAEAYQAGDHTVVWDGLDDNGNGVTAGNYTWKLLETEGLTAEFQFLIGTNPPDASWTEWVGDTQGATGVAFDNNGNLIVAGGYVENVPRLIRLTPDGNTRLAAQPDLDDGGYGSVALGIGVMSDGIERVYMLQDRTGNEALNDVQISRWYNDGLFVGNGTSGNVMVNGDRPIDMSVAGNLIGLVYENSGLVRLLDADDFSEIASTTISGANGIALTGDGAGDNIFITTSDNKLVSITQLNLAAQTRIDGQALNSPAKIDVDSSNGDIYLWNAGTQQVLRYNSSYQLQNTYGTSGGRADGLYVETDFKDVVEITATGNGSFWVAESSAPRRLVRIDSLTGAVQTDADGDQLQWYGGQNFYTSFAVDPGDNRYVWGDSTPGYIVQYDVDWTNKSWTVNAVYANTGIGDGLFPNRFNGEEAGSQWRVVRSSGGDTFLAYSNSPAFLKVDEASGSLVPVSIMSTIKQNGTGLNGFPQPWVSAVLAEGYTVDDINNTNTNTVTNIVEGPVPIHYSWADTNGDGVMDASEFDIPGGITVGFPDRPGSFNSNLDYVAASNVFEGSLAYRTADRVDWTGPNSDIPVYSWGAVNPGGVYDNVADNNFPIFISAYQDSDGNTFVTYNGSGPEKFQPYDETFRSSTARILKFDANDQFVGDLGTTLWEPTVDRGQGGFFNPAKVIGEVDIVGSDDDAIVAIDRIEQGAVAFTQDGLYIGTLLDNRANDGLPDVVYNWTFNQSGPIQFDSVTGHLFTDTRGDTFWFAAGANDSPVYKITGWDDLRFQTGLDALVVGEQVQTASLNGTGLTALYYRDASFTDFAYTAENVSLNQDWGTGGPIALPTDGFGVRFVGEFEPPTSDTYKFLIAMSTDDQVRMLIDGVEVINSIGDPQILPRGEIYLRAGQQYDIVIEYADLSGEASISVQWEATNIDRQSVPINVLSGAPLVSLNMNDVIGESVMDQSGRGNDARLVGGVTASPGIAGQALQFDGTDGMALVDPTASLSQISDSLTVSVWASSIVDHWSSDATLVNKGRSFSLRPVGGTKTIAFDVSVNGQIHSVYYTPTINLTEYHHYVGSYDGSTIRLYINGQEVASAAVSGQITGDGGALLMGVNDTGTAFYTGFLDEFKLYDRALSISEIEDLYYQMMDPPLVRSFAIDSSASEDGPSHGIIRVTRSGNTLNDLSVPVAVGGMVTEGDYEAIPSQIVIPAGQSYVDVIVVPVLDGVTDEPLELLTLEIAHGDGFTSGEFSGTGISEGVLIQDADALNAVETISGDSQEELDNAGWMNVDDQQFFKNDLGGGHSATQNAGGLTSGEIHVDQNFFPNRVPRSGYVDTTLSFEGGFRDYATLNDPLYASGQVTVTQLIGFNSQGRYLAGFVASSNNDFTNAPGIGLRVDQGKIGLGISHKGIFISAPTKIDLIEGLDATTHLNTAITFEYAWDPGMRTLSGTLTPAGGLEQSFSITLTQSQFEQMAGFQFDRFGAYTMGQSENNSDVPGSGSHFEAKLDDLTYGTRRAQAVNDQPVVWVEASEPSARETDQHAGTLTVFANRNGITGDILVSYNVSGTASATDYTETLDGTVTIPDGEDSVQIDITPTLDSMVEGDESVIMTLDNSPSTYVVDSDHNNGVVVIRDAGQAPATVSLTINDASASEVGQDPGQFTITRTGSTEGNLLVSYLLSGTANDDDFVESLSGSALILDGQSSVVIDITPLLDGLAEGPESLTIELISAAPPSPNEVYDDFDTLAPQGGNNLNEIDGTKWVVIGDNWGRDTQFIPPGADEPVSPLVRSQRTGESATGNLKSEVFSIGEDQALQVLAIGFIGNGGNPSYSDGSVTPSNEFIVYNAVDDTVIARFSPDADTPTTYVVDPRGATEIYLEVVDGSTQGGFGWIGLDTVEKVRRVGGQSDLINNGSFEDLGTGWTALDGTTAWDYLRQHTDQYLAAPAEGGLFASTGADESDTGILRSSAITVTRSQLSFAIAGWSGQNGEQVNGDGIMLNHLRLLDSNLDVIAGSEVVVPLSDSWAPVSLEFSDLGVGLNDTIYIEVVDGYSNNSFGWIAVDDFRQTGDDLALGPIEQVYFVGADNSGTIDLADSQQAVSIVANDPIAGEDTLDAGQFTVTRVGGTSGALNINYTVTGSATSGSDFTALSGVVTIRDQDVSATIDVQILQDLVTEGAETIIVTLDAGTGYGVLAQNSDLIIIPESDGGEGNTIVTLSATDDIAVEGTADDGVFTFTRYGGTTDPQEVFYAVSGSANSGDYSPALIGSVTIPSGSASTTITIEAIADGVFESDETLTLTLIDRPTPTGTVFENFEDGDLSDWTITGTAWELGPNNGYGGPNQYGGAVGHQGSQWIDSWPDDEDRSINNDGLTGSLTSPIFTLDTNTLRFKLAGFGGNGLPASGSFSDQTTIADMEITWELRVVNGPLIAQGSGPFSGPVFKDIVVDVSDYIDQDVQLTITDNETRSFGWIALDDLRSDYRAGETVLSLEVGADQSGWTIDPNSSFAFRTVLNASNDRHAREGGELIASTDTGEGNAKSPTFTITRDTIEFYSAGFGVNEGNAGVNGALIQLVRDVNGVPEVLMTWGEDGKNLGGDNWKHQTGDVSAYADEVVYLRLQDRINGSFGWVGLDDVRLTGDYIGAGGEPGSYIIGTPDTGTVTIENAGASAELTVSSRDAISAELGAESGEFLITRVGDTTNALTVNYVIEGTASNGDYVETFSGIAEIPAGESQVALTVTPASDALLESNETVTLRLLNSTEYSIALTGAATVTIFDQSTPTISIAATDASAAEVGNDPGQFVITRAGNTLDPLTVYYDVTGTASSSDYSGTLTGQVYFAPGQTEAVININPIDDIQPENLETVTLTLTSDSSYALGGQTSATVTITSEDLPTVTISAPDALAAEQGTDPGQFVVTRNGPTTSPLTVYYNIDGTASGGDYNSSQTLSGSVVIGAGSTTATIDITPIDDSDNEGFETLTLTLTLPVDAAYTLDTQNSATVGIADDENNTIVTIAASAPDASENLPDNGQFTVTRVGDTTLPLIVNYTVGGTATSTDDYESLSGAVTILAGQTTATIDLMPIDDALFESDETVVLTLSDSAFYDPGTPNSATVTIGDNDGTPTVNIAAITPEAIESPTRDGQFTVSRNGPTTAPLEVFYVVSGTATSGDYTQTLSGSVVIEAGQSSVLLDITPVADGVVELDETLTLTLIAAPQYQGGTVVDDFEDGDFAGWTITGNAWENGPNNNYNGPNQYGTASGHEGSRWADSWADDGSNNDGPIGTMTSPAFTIDGNTLRFKLSGFGGNGQGAGGGNFGTSTQIANMTNTWELRRVSDNALLIQGTAPFRDPQFVGIMVDVSDYLGESVQLKVIDNATGGFGWMGIDDIRTDTRDVTSVFTLEVGDDQGAWQLSAGSSFAYHAVLNNTLDRHAREGGEFLRSQDGSTGNAQSPTFVITRETLAFDSAGFGVNEGGAGANGALIELVRDSDGTVLLTVGDDETLGGDSWKSHSLDVSNYADEVVYLRLVDRISGGYGWVGIDDVRLTGASIGSAAPASSNYNIGTNDHATVTIKDNHSSAQSQASDGFESGDGTGGTGWAGHWTFTGGASISSSDSPYTGVSHLHLSNTAQATRAVDMSAATSSNAALEFFWKADSLEAGETAIVEIYDGTQWLTIFTITSAMSDNTYHFASVDLSTYTLNSDFQVRFSINGDSIDDGFWIDELLLIG